MINLLRRFFGGKPRLTEEAIEFLRSRRELGLFFHADEEVRYWFSRRPQAFKDAFWNAYNQRKAI